MVPAMGTRATQITKQKKVTMNIIFNRIFQFLLKKNKSINQTMMKILRDVTTKLVESIEI